MGVKSTLGEHKREESPDPVPDLSHTERANKGKTSKISLVDKAKCTDKDHEKVRNRSSTETLPATLLSVRSCNRWAILKFDVDAPLWK